MKVIYHKSMGTYYLHEKIKFRDPETGERERLTIIREKRKTSPRHPPDIFDGAILTDSRLFNMIDQYGLKIYNIAKSEINTFCAERNLNPFILHEWTSKNKDGSLTYNPRRYFLYFDNTLIMRRPPIGETYPFILPSMTGDYNIKFTPLRNIPNVIIPEPKSEHRAYKLPLYHMVEKNNLEYRVYLSKKDKENAILNYYGIT